MCARTWIHGEDDEEKKVYNDMSITNHLPRFTIVNQMS